MPPPRHPLVDVQIAYYDARATEYESSLAFSDGRFADRNPDAQALWLLQQFVRSLSHVETTLEVACGTGIWTQEFVKISGHVHAVDASANMIALNRRASNPKVTYECANIFEWNPSRRFERVAAAFWLSHVPDDLLKAFVAKVDAALLPGGQALIIDEAMPGESECSPGRVARELHDGSHFEIVKNCRNGAEIRDAFDRTRYMLDAGLQTGRLVALLMSRRQSL